MRLTLSDDQMSLARTAQKFVRERSPISRLRELRDERDDVGFSRELWRELAELGFLGLSVPEAYGGSGLGFVELCCVLEACGSQLVPEPLASTLLLGVQTLLLGGSEAQRAEWLPRVVRGDATLTLAEQEPGSRWDVRAVQATARATPDGFVLDGEKLHVLDAQAADALIVPARTDEQGSLSLFLVPRGAVGLTLERQLRIDSRSVGRVVLRDVVVDRGARVGGLHGGGALLDAVVDRARIGLSAEALGAAQQAFELTVAYLKEREQFGVKIGTFQALQHRAARMYIELSLARSAVLAAARAVDDEPGAVPAYASLAKARVAEAFTLIANEGVQMHGGVGVTDEYDIGFYLKRARVFDATLGDAGYHVDRWAKLAGY